MKTTQPAYLHYFSVFLLRKLVYAMIVFNFHEVQYTIMQTYSNILLSFAFLLYLVVFKPFLDKTEQMINMFNEITYYIVACFFLCFTNYNPDAEVKVQLGWLVVLICISNLLYPNGYIMVKGIWPDIKKALTCKKEKEVKINTQKQESKREELIYKYNIELKKEFQEREEDDIDIKRVRSNQVVPTIFYTEYRHDCDFFCNRTHKKVERKGISVKSQFEKVEFEHDIHSPRLLSIEENSLENDEEMIDDAKMDEILNNID